MGSSNRNHHRNLQVAVAVAVDQNFLIFGGRFSHQRRGPTLLLSENCDSTEKDWTDRSLRVWVDHQQQPQPRSGCTSRLRLKIAVVDGALLILSSHMIRLTSPFYIYSINFLCHHNSSFPILLHLTNASFFILFALIFILGNYWYTCWYMSYNRCTAAFLIIQIRKAPLLPLLIV